ncbi:MAG: hypothetical protein A3D92_15030 [Bacteroidetes bacterium RIFCSPHIGHO2_02_FULL_44_7]|nr:MAG: hypothetical protein A3D92_15030 [Bacteroidetes bacterium RIFCSPHIGHO2_02_FULL_44_7]
MKILLSPAKNIDMSRTVATNEATAPYFIKDAEALMSKMRKFSAGKIGKMMSLSKDLADLNFERNQNWQATTELNGENAHAVAIFNGEVYRGLDAPTMTPENLERAQADLRILSGLYGLLKPLDVIYPYRLEMGTKWAVTPAKKNLYQFWGKRISTQLNSEEKDCIVNLASAEYFKAADAKNLKARVITPVFKEYKNGAYTMLMVYAKQARGRMARFIIDQEIHDAEQIKLFALDGYAFDANLSSEHEWVFTR